MEKSRLIGAVLAAALSYITAPSHAALIGVLPTTPGGTDWQAYYDDVAGLTWLQDANAGADSIYDDGSNSADGRMSWSNASDWAASLNINGVTGWRLPDTNAPTDPDGGYCLGNPGDLSCPVANIGEMGDFYYNVLGGVTGSTIWATNNANYDLFSNTPTSAAIFWLETAYPFADYHWLFDMGNTSTSGGYQGRLSGSNTYLAWAVYEGNAGAAVVPVPAAVWLFGSALLGLGFVKRKRA